MAEESEDETTESEIAEPIVFEGIRQSISVAIPAHSAVSGSFTCIVHKGDALSISADASGSASCAGASVNVDANRPEESTEQDVPVEYCTEEGLCVCTFSGANVTGPGYVSVSVGSGLRHLSVSPAGVSLPISGGSVDLEISGDFSSWKVKNVQGSFFNAGGTVSAARNNALKRRGSFEIEATMLDGTTETQTVSVFQDGEAFRIHGANFYGNGGGAGTFNFNPKEISVAFVSGNVPWASQTIKHQPGNVNYTGTVKISANPGAQRTVTYVYEATSQDCVAPETASVTFTQAAADAYFPPNSTTSVQIPPGTPSTPADLPGGNFGEPSGEIAGGARVGSVIFQSEFGGQMNFIVIQGIN